MSRISASLGLSTLRDDALGGDPRLPQLEDSSISPEIQELFDRALAGDLPRTRELKPWEPQRLNERHLAMVMMRVSGVQQRQIAETFGATDSNVSIVLNHPDAEFLLSRLAAARFSMPTEIEQRLQALNEDAVGALEDLLQDAEVPALKKAPSAFRLLEMNGYGKRKPDVVKHEHEFSANPQQMAQLTKAIREAQTIKLPEVAEFQDAEVVESRVGSAEVGSLSPGDAAQAVPPDIGAPSVDDSQEATPSRQGD